MDERRHGAGITTEGCGGLLGRQGASTPRAVGRGERSADSARAQVPTWHPREEQGHETGSTSGSLPPASRFGAPRAPPGAGGPRRDSSVSGRRHGRRHDGLQAPHRELDRGSAAGLALRPQPRLEVLEFRPGADVPRPRRRVGALPSTRARTTRPRGGRRPSCSRRPRERGAEHEDAPGVGLKRPAVAAVAVARMAASWSWGSTRASGYGVLPLNKVLRGGAARPSAAASIFRATNRGRASSGGFRTRVDSQCGGESASMASRSQNLRVHGPLVQTSAQFQRYPPSRGGWAAALGRAAAICRGCSSERRQAPGASVATNRSTYGGVVSTVRGTAELLSEIRR